MEPAIIDKGNLAGDKNEFQKLYVETGLTDLIISQYDMYTYIIFFQLADIVKN